MVIEESSGLRAGKDFLLGVCPERVMPGRLLGNIETMNRVCGGMTIDASEVMVALYRHIVHADLDLADDITAELVKTTENAYRDVQIAFANEVALISEALGADVWKVRELVNKSPGREMLLPGAGVGGHCIPKDSWLLAWSAEKHGLSVRLVPAARAVNDFMPTHVVNLIIDALDSDGGESLKGARILVLGLAYLEDSDDTRNSPSHSLSSQLRGFGAEVVIHDPYVLGYQGDIVGLATNCDTVVLMVRHDEYSRIDLDKLKRVMRRPILVDGRGLIDGHQAADAGYIYRAVGYGGFRDS